MTEITQIQQIITKNKTNPYLIEISIANDWELLLKRLQKPNSNIKTVVSTMSKLSWVLDGSEWTTSLCLWIKSSSRVPSTHTNHQTQQKKNHTQIISKKNAQIIKSNQIKKNNRKQIISKKNHKLLPKKMQQNLLQNIDDKTSHKSLQHGEHKSLPKKNYHNHTN